MESIPAHQQNSSIYSGSWFYIPPRGLGWWEWLCRVVMLSPCLRYGRGTFHCEHRKRASGLCTGCPKRGTTGQANEGILYTNCYMTSRLFNKIFHHIIWNILYIKYLETREYGFTILWTNSCRFLLYSHIYPNMQITPINCLMRRRIFNFSLQFPRLCYSGILIKRNYCLASGILCYVVKSFQFIYRNLTSCAINLNKVYQKGDQYSMLIFKPIICTC